MCKSVTAIIVDDEADSRELMANLLCTYFPEIKILGVAANVEEAYKLVVKSSPQLVFLDIQMPRANGFNLLTRFKQVPFEVIFVTSYDQYAINAIKFNALDYILKPVEIEELQETIKRAILKISQNDRSASHIVNLLYNLDSQNRDKTIALHVSDKVRILNVAEIMYIEADGRYCTVYHRDNQQFTTARILKDFEDYLAQESSFIRVSKSYLINLRFLKCYSKGEPFMIEMTNGMVFEIPRRKKSEILERLR